MGNSLDTAELERQVKSMYRDVAASAEADFHFETGRDLAERLGYDPDDLDAVPDAAVDSFAGVGYYFDTLALEPGENVLDLGSGSGMDAFVAGLHVADGGSVTGVDMTDEQVEKARILAAEGGFHNVDFREGYIEDLPFDDESFDAVISNGVINLSAEKERVFEEAGRVLEPGGRLALADIVSEQRLPAGIKSDADLWAACIGGAEQIDSYASLVETAGFEVLEVRDNSQYEFVSEQAANACQAYGVKSISLSARKRA
ncbi:methyltransferase domain-containing protein [Natrialbaceae archaeon AArc-T1-2]|uniref:methyltransferase domain-containing protein n=1 Tax=Natrialbaceae archaeon AArc-T1-2 TaxID=3053904 RepID=UPI00255A83F0|nr:methyltransferase domain-containing protein [Natrialbaceae archaeon AArc-T1-2]WIV67121.1 methyltransferase domain-containing protein [Natrialbaceae archaeon AArc-T1-2]